MRSSAHLFTEAHHLPFNELQYAAMLPHSIGCAGLVIAAWLGDMLNRRVLLAGFGYLITAVCVYPPHKAAASPWCPLPAAAVFFHGLVNSPRSASSPPAISNGA